MTAQFVNIIRQFTGQLVAQHLQCIRDDRVLFTDLNFSLTNGQLLQVEGPNGSGKTSLLRILCGLALPAEGTVLWNGHDIRVQSADYWANLAYIGHAPGIKADLTPLENLAMARTLAAAATTVSLTAALAHVGLDGFEDVPTRTLSAGQQRRVAMARLLVNSLPLWILDEPFTALDQNAIVMIENLLATHAQRGGMAIFTSHHALKAVQADILHLNA